MRSAKAAKCSRARRPLRLQHATAVRPRRGGRLPPPRAVEDRVTASARAARTRLRARRQGRRRGVEGADVGVFDRELETGRGEKDP